jgi:membrane protease YdiL (CAAX protease family)
MLRLGSLVPIVFTLLLASVLVVVYRFGSPAGAIRSFAVVGCVAVVLSVAYLLREEALEELILVKAGDLSRGIAGAAFALVLLYAAVRLTISLSPTFAVRELVKIVSIRETVHAQVTRGALEVLWALSAEFAFRGAVARALEERFGSQFAPWVASGLFVLATFPSMQLPVIVSAVCIGVPTAYLTSQSKRLAPAVVAHAMFTWLSMEMLLQGAYELLRMQGRVA